jgi:hypothetical protein
MFVPSPLVPSIQTGAYVSFALGLPLATLALATYLKELRVTAGSLNKYKRRIINPTSNTAAA